MRALEFDGQEFPWKWWNGEKLRGSDEQPLAVDTETALIAGPLDVPEPVIGLAFDGDQLCVIHRSKLAKFVAAHRLAVWCGHNLQFDFWTIFKHSDPVTQERLWSIGDRNGYRCTQTLDLLIQLATGNHRFAGASHGDNARLYPTNLGTLAEEYGCGELDKEDPYRLRFGELLGLSEKQIDAHPESAGFLSYALKDPIATWRVYQKQRVQALELMRKAGWSPDPNQKTYEIHPNAVRDYGVLSECLQTNASIVLAELSRTPLRIDQEARVRAEAEARERYQGHLNRLLEADPLLIKRYKAKRFDGKVKTTKQSLLPQFDQKRLVAILEAEAARLNCDPPKSNGKLKGTSTSAKTWFRFADRSEFIAAWAELEKEAKLLEFLTAIDAPEIYSRYNLLMMNGRTSAGAYKSKGKLLLPSINVQQMPREDPAHPERSVRSLFLPPPGKKWFDCDYGYAELRTLAAWCRAKFGWSKLGEAVEDHTKRGGVDPHQRVAAALLDLSIEDYLQLPKDTQKKARQNAKPISFGYPGGLGTKTFVTYAKVSYGADFTPKEAKEAKKKWLEVYPEMKLHLADRTQEAIEWQIGTKYRQLPWFQRKRLSDFLKGDKKDRAGFSTREREAIWEVLGELAHIKGDEQLIEDVEYRRITEGLRRLLTYRACTLTGRIRNNVKYTDGANTPFSGLAADGAKKALWALMRRGVHLLSFIHDSVAVAVDPARAKGQCDLVKRLMVSEMEKVIGQGVPVAVDGTLGERWGKVDR